MTDEEFCRIETAISGEEIDKVEQLTHCAFTGRELKEYLEQAFVIYGVSQQRELLKAFQSIKGKEESIDLRNLTDNELDKFIEAYLLQ